MIWVGGQLLLEGLSPPTTGFIQPLRLFNLAFSLAVAAGPPKLCCDPLGIRQYHSHWQVNWGRARQSSYLSLQFPTSAIWTVFPPWVAVSNEMIKYTKPPQNSPSTHRMLGKYELPLFMGHFHLGWAESELKFHSRSSECFILSL